MNEKECQFAIADLQLKKQETSPCLPIANCKLQIANPKAFTLIELLTTLAVLVIVLGLMVSLARHVRDRSAEQFTRDLLVQLDRWMARYAERNAGQYPPVAPLIDPNTVTAEPALQAAARQNNQDFLQALRRCRDLADSSFADLPILYYDQTTLRDAWGSPIVFLPPYFANVGMAPQPRPFFLSAGPDRRFSSREDNLYSYEVTGK